MWRGRWFGNNCEGYGLGDGFVSLIPDEFIGSVVEYCIQERYSLFDTKAVGAD